MKTPFYTAAIIAVAAIGQAAASPQQAVSQVRENAVQVQSILAKANGSNDAAVRKQAENYALPYFDFQRMTAYAVGQPWTQASDAQKLALTREFQTLLIRTYSGTMLTYKDAKVTVNENPVVNKGGKEVTVSVDVTPPGGKAVKMDFTTYQSGGKYRVFNVAVAGGSLVTIYRNQFGQTIKTKGFDGLIAELKAKNGSK